MDLYNLPEEQRNQVLNPQFQKDVKNIVDGIERAFGPAKPIRSVVSAQHRSSDELNLN